MPRTRAALFPAALLALLGSPAAAEFHDVTGHWTCNYGVEDDGLLDRLPVYIQFDLVVQEDGWAFGQGVMAGGGERVATSLQGGWQVDDDTFSIRGQVMSAAGIMPFLFSTRVLSGSFMAMTYHSGDGNVVSSTCERPG